MNLTTTKPRAEEFTDWVCKEVLTSLRKQGFFGQVPPGDELRLTAMLLKLVNQLKAERDAFTRELLIRRLRNICNKLGEPMPDLKLLGQDFTQLDLEV